MDSTQQQAQQAHLQRLVELKHHPEIAAFRNREWVAIKLLRMVTHRLAQSQADVERLKHEVATLTRLIDRLTEEKVAGVQAARPAEPAVDTRLLVAAAGLEEKNRTRMLRNVERYWIQDVLHRTITEANAFHVGYELHPDAVLKHRDLSDCQLPQGADFGRLLDYLRGDVLILGDPGSGKTILLLQLAEQLL